MFTNISNNELFSSLKTLTGPSLAFINISSNEFSNSSGFNTQQNSFYIVKFTVNKNINPFIPVKS